MRRADQIAQVHRLADALGTDREEAAHGVARACALLDAGLPPVQSGRTLLSGRRAPLGSGPRLGWRRRMRAIVCRALEGPDSLELVDLPVPGARRLRRADPRPCRGRELRRQPDAARPLPGEAAIAVHARPRARRGDRGRRRRRARPGAGAAGAGGGQSRRFRRAGRRPRRGCGAAARTTWTTSPRPVSPSPTAPRMARLRWRADLHAGETPCRAWCRRRRRPDRGRVRQGHGCHGHRHRAR